MPDITDSPDGVHPHVKVDVIEGHPDGAVRLWVKQKFHVMGTTEARAVAKELTRVSDEVDGTSVAPAVGAAESELDALVAHAGA